MSDNAVARVDRGTSINEQFSGTEIERRAETAMAAAGARERAAVEARYVVAMRNPRNWNDVRAMLLDHCDRPSFAERARYSKPVGQELINGEWVPKKATGFTIRFAETLAQTMRNVMPELSVSYEDERIRIIRITVTDLEANLPWSQEVTIAKTVEKRGFKNKKTQEWEPPEGRQVIGVRLNSRGEPTYLVIATDEELRSKINAERSKTQRDFLIKLCPRDILDDCEEKIAEARDREDKKDPKAALKRLLDRFKEFGIMPSDLTTYVGKPTEQWTPLDRKELTELGLAIRENEITFSEALRLKYAAGQEGEPEGEGETHQQHDARLQRKMREQAPKREDLVDAKVNELKRESETERPRDLAEELRQETLRLGKSEFLRVLGTLGYTEVDELPNEIKTIEALRALREVEPQQPETTTQNATIEPAKRGWGKK